MPEVVSCPKCQRKSRVPDSLVGKKVKCPGCAEIFVANLNGPAAAPKKPAPAKKEEEEDDGGTYEVVREGKKRRRDDDDDDDERVADKPISRRRAGDDDDDEDKPRKSRTRRDDDDDDDDRVSTRRRRYSRDDDDDDDDDDMEQSRPRKSEVAADWSRIRLGLSLLLASVLTYVGVILLTFLGGCCIGFNAAAGGAAAAGAGGKPAAGGLAAFGTTFLLVIGVAVLGQFTAWALKVGGSICCVGSPPAFGARTLAVVSISMIGAEALLTVLQMVVNFASNGANAFMMMGGNPMMGGGAAPGVAGGAAGGAAAQMAIGLLGSAIWLGWLFVIGLYIRSLGMCLRNYSLAGTAKGWLITLGITIVLLILMVIVAVATIGLAGMNIANQMGAMNQGKPQGPGAAGGAMAGAGVVLCGLAGISMIMGLVLLIWYIVMLAQARGSITGRMTR